MKELTSKIGFLFCLLSVLPLVLTSCSSDEDDGPIYNDIVEENNPLSDFFTRYNLPNDKKSEILSYSIKNKVDPSLLVGYNSDYEVAVIICDTIANKPLYVNYNQFTLPSSVEFSLPYGENTTGALSHLGVADAISVNKNLAASLRVRYAGTLYSSYYAEELFYRLFYSHNGNITITETPKVIMTEQLLAGESVLEWFENTYLFYYRHYNGSKYPEELEYASCYNTEGQLCYEALYPSIDNLDLLNARLMQPISMSSAIGVNITSTKVDAFAINVEDHELLWHDTATNSAYEYKENDRTSYSNVSYSNNTLTFTVDILSYDGSKKSYDVAITADGSISFPTNG